MFFTLIILLCQLATKSESKHSLFDKPACFPTLNETSNKDLIKSQSLFSKERESLILCDGHKANMFQHFVFCLFPYLNIITFLSDTGEITKENIPKLLLNGSHTHFNRIDRWIESVLGQLKPLLGEFIGLSNETNDNNNYIEINYENFHLTRSFTLRLSGYLNKFDICHEIKKIQQTSVETNILIIDRKSKRKITNIREVMYTLEKTRNTKPKLVYFEKMNVSQQLDLIRSNGIVIAAHGAAITNTFALPLCGQLLEIFPYGYCAQDYYSRLNLDRHFLYAEGLNKHTTNSCLIELNLSKTEVHGSNLSENIILNASLCHPAMFKHHGRLCLRKADISVNITQLQLVLQKAILQRFECLKKSRLIYK